MLQVPGTSEPRDEGGSAAGKPVSLTTAVVSRNFKPVFTKATEANWAKGQETTEKQNPDHEASALQMQTDGLCM